MRALKASTLNKKLRPSKFFEHFLNANGPTCTAKASTADIQVKLKVLYLDLACGNLQQNKYYQYFIGDPRIVQEAINDLQNKVLESLVYRDALRFTANRPQDPESRPILANPIRQNLSIRKKIYKSSNPDNKSSNDELATPSSISFSLRNTRAVVIASANAL